MGGGGGTGDTGLVTVDKLFENPARYIYIFIYIYIYITIILYYIYIYLTIISRTRVGYELLDSGRGAEH